MQQHFPQLDATNSAGYFSQPVPPPWHQRREFRVFSVIFLLCLTTSLVYCLSRPPVYRSTASLTLLGEAESERYWTSSETSQQNQPAGINAQHLAVQSKILMNQRLLESVWNTISRNPAQPLEEIQTFKTMQNMLSVHSMGNTHLVELQADGPEPYILPVLLNTWIDTYRQIRSQNIDESASLKSVALTDQLETLKAEIRDKRKALETFKQKHGIMSGVRDENPTLSKLAGLNRSLNKANEEAVKARSARESAEQAVARGERVYLDNSNNRESLAELEKSAQLLRERMTQLEQQYTRDYINMVPDLKAVPEQLRAVESRLAAMEKMDQERVLSSTGRDAQAAEKEVRRLQRQLDDFKQSAGEFAARFSEYEEHRSALETLEKHYRNTEEKILKTKIRQHQKYPDIEVISEPFLPRQNIAPDNLRDSLIAVAASFILGLLGVWVCRILVPAAPFESPAITLSGIHMYPDGNNPVLPPAMHPPRLNHTGTVSALPEPLPKELSDQELQLLWNHAPLKGKQLIGTLLNGLTLEQAALIREDHIDFGQDNIIVPGENTRVVSMAPGLRVLFRQSSTVPAWRNSGDVNAEDLRVLLECLATDADLSTERASSAVLRHCYLIYLVRQGIKLSELADIAGDISSSALSTYRMYSPPGKGKSIREIDPVHPFLKG